MSHRTGRVALRVKRRDWGRSEHIPPLTRRATPHRRRRSRSGSEIQRRGEAPAAGLVQIYASQRGVRVVVAPGIRQIRVRDVLHVELEGRVDSGARHAEAISGESITEEGLVAPI